MWKIVLISLVLAVGCGDKPPASNDNRDPNSVTNNSTANNTQPNNQTTTFNSQTNNTQTNNNGQTSPNNAQTNNNAQTGNNGTSNNQNPGCPLPEAFDVGAAYANTIELDVGADIEQALRDATPGTTILLAAGQHTGGIGVAGVTGEPTAPIRVLGADGAEIVGGASAIQLSDAAYVVFENFTVRDADQNGFNIDDGGDYSTPAHHVVFRDITVRNIGNGGNQDCIKLSGLDDFHIENVDLAGCSGQAIDMVGCHDGTITGNFIHDTPGAGVQAKGGTSDVLVHRTSFVDVAGRSVNLGGSTGLEFFRPIDAPHEGARIYVYSNVMVRPGETATAFVGCDACEAINNTIVHPQRWVARVLQETVDPRFVPSRNGVFANNIIVFQSSVLRTFVNVGGDTAPDTFTFRNNLWWDLDDPNFGGPTLTDGIPAEQSGIVADPGFDANGTDFSITAASPAAGVGSSAPAVPDFTDVCFAEPPAVGAFEAQ